MRWFQFSQKSDQRGWFRLRDKNLSFIQFSEQIESFIRRKIPIKIPERAVIDSPTLPQDFNGFKFITNRLIELRGLALISYYVPYDLGLEIRTALEEKAKYLGWKDKLRLNSLLFNHPSCLAFLYETDEFTSSEIFGNLIERGLFALRFLQVKRKKRRPRRTLRRRGYNDHGSLRSQDKWLPTNDWSLTVLQNELERKLSITARSHHKLEQILRRIVVIHLSDHLD